MYLTRSGEVVLTDEEDGPLRPADPAERDFTLARAAEHHPELAHLKPTRPRHAVTCDRCGGQGRVPLQTRSSVYCPDCNSLGWTATS